MKLSNLIIGCMTIILSGCVSMETPKDAQGWINEGRVTLIATANLVSDNVKGDIMTPSEGQVVLNKVREYSKVLDDAQKLLDTGFANESIDKAKLVNTLITSLHKEVAAKAREAKPNG